MKNLIVTVNGVAYNVTVEEGTGTAAASAPVAAAPGRRSGTRRCTCSGCCSCRSRWRCRFRSPSTAPMPGNILDIKVKAGAAVKAGDALS